MPLCNSKSVLVSAVPISSTRAKLELAKQSIVSSRIHKEKYSISRIPRKVNIITPT